MMIRCLPNAAAAVFLENAGCKPVIVHIMLLSSMPKLPTTNNLLCPPKTAAAAA